MGTNAKLTMLPKGIHKISAVQMKIYLETLKKQKKNHKIHMK